VSIEKEASGKKELTGTMLLTEVPIGPIQCILVKCRAVEDQL
jgi:hypothetical protein